MSTIKQVLIAIGNSPLWMVMVAYWCGLIHGMVDDWTVTTSITLAAMLCLGWVCSDYERKN